MYFLKFLRFFKFQPTAAFHLYLYTRKGTMSVWFYDYDTLLFHSKLQESKQMSTLRSPPPPTLASQLNPTHCQWFDFSCVFDTSLCCCVLLPHNLFFSNSHCSLLFAFSLPSLLHWGTPRRHPAPSLTQHRRCSHQLAPVFPRVMSFWSSNTTTHQEATINPRFVLSLEVWFLLTAPCCLTCFLPFGVAWERVVLLNSGASWR